MRAPAPLKLPVEPGRDETGGVQSGMCRCMEENLPETGTVALR